MPMQEVESALATLRGNSWISGAKEHVPRPAQCFQCVKIFHEVQSQLLSPTGEEYAIVLDCTGRQSRWLEARPTEAEGQENPENPEDEGEVSEAFELWHEMRSPAEMRLATGVDLVSVNVLTSLIHDDASGVGTPDVRWGQPWVECAEETVGFLQVIQDLPKLLNPSQLDRRGTAVLHRLLYEVNHYLVDGAIHQSQENYAQYHREIFDKEGNFLEDKWKVWTGPYMELCNMPVTRARFATAITFLWCARMVSEIHDSIKLTRTLCALETLPAGESPAAGMKLERNDMEEIETIKVHSVGHAIRLNLLITVTLPKVLVAMALLYCGMRFLVATQSMADVILNALALEAIISIDNLMYEAFTPASTRRHVEQTVLAFLAKDKDESPAERENKNFRTIMTYWLILLSVAVFAYVYTSEIQQVLPNFPHDLRPHCDTWFEKMFNPPCPQAGAFRVSEHSESYIPVPMGSSNSSRLRSVRADLVAWNSAAQVAARVRWPEALAMLLCQAPAAGLQLSDVSWSLAASAAQRWEHALQLVPEIPLHGPLRNVAIAALAEGQQWEAALALLGDSPDVVALSSCMAALQGSPEAWQKAVALLQRCGSLADVVAYGACMSACGQELQWQLALHLHQEMKLLALQPNAVTWSCLSSAFAAAQAWPWALSTVSELGHHGQDLQPATTSAAAAAYAARRRWRPAMQLLQDLVVASSQLHIVACNSLLAALLRGGAVVRALALAEEFRARRLQPTMATYDVELAACAARGGPALHHTAKLLDDIALAAPGLCM
ncbi:unnamed protein product [Symbiodinium natans]|uniref:Pentatricopeptide repeat-containing protein, chloroplastic n=1 Tax=Symbiodinium natans TaxID=878477 RepID=A0A812K842_9DINO|nr:unnamed protein product [Symbiodinium natans]